MKHPRENDSQRQLLGMTNNKIIQELVQNEKKNINQNLLKGLKKKEPKENDFGFEMENKKSNESIVEKKKKFFENLNNQKDESSKKNIREKHLESDEVDNKKIHIHLKKKEQEQEQELNKNCLDDTLNADFFLNMSDEFQDEETIFQKSNDLRTMSMNSFTKNMNILPIRGVTMWRKHLCSNYHHSQKYYIVEQDLFILINGYTNCQWKKTFYLCSCFMTLGLGYLFFLWFPKLKFNMLGNKSSLKKADWCVIEDEYGDLTVAKIIKKKLNQKFSSFLNVDTKSHESFSSLHFDEIKNPIVPYVHMFCYRYIRFFYHPIDNLFKTISNWNDPRWKDIENAKNGLYSSVYFQRLDFFNRNSLVIEEKSIFRLFKDELTHPFYVFQIFSITLWMFDSYYYYASCIFLISLFSISNSIFETKSSIKKIKNMSNFSCMVRIWRNNFWKKIDSTEIVPGDVFEVDSSLSTVPCDAFLINGECTVNESLLTGESVPVLKKGTPHNGSQMKFKDFTHGLSKSFIYCGTTILKRKSYNNDPIIALAVKTGFNTIKGSLIRSILFTKPVGFKIYKDSFKYIILMTVIAALGSIYSLVNFILMKIPISVIILRSLDIITIIVPPALPATLTIGTTFAINRLKKSKIFCISPNKVNIGGKIDLVCFDKTGTLTEDNLSVLCVHISTNLDDRHFSIPFNTVDELKNGFNVDVLTNDHNSIMIYCMASCHSLITINNNIFGDPLDINMFYFTTWLLTENNKYNKVISDDSSIKILKIFEFDSSLRRMSTIVTTHDNNHFVFTKGAPEVLVDICKSDTIPSNFYDLLNLYSHKGYRLITCAYKRLSSNDLTINQRFWFESNLTFLGLIVFENKLKVTTKFTLKQLRNATIRTIMCTGDNVLTAINVSKESDLISKDVKKIYVPSFQNNFMSLNNLIWTEINNSENVLTTEETFSLVQNLNQEFKLAITGKVFEFFITKVQNKKLIDIILLHCDIFSRMSPDEKHDLIVQFQRLNHCICFCGDGANDCRALKIADVGISLSEAEASIAAPFTSNNNDILCVLKMIKEGRSSLVISFSCFRFMSIYSVIQFITISILYKRGINLGDIQFLYIDLFLIFPLAISMSWFKPNKVISVHRPSFNILSLKMIVSLVSHVISIMFFQIFLWFYIQKQSWYIKPIPGTDNYVTSFDNTVLFLFSNFQYILFSYVLTVGPPFCESILKNIPFIIILFIATSVSFGLFFVKENSSLGISFKLINLPKKVYFIIIFFALMNLVIAMLLEYYTYKNTFFLNYAFSKFKKKKKSSTLIFCH